MLYEDLSANMMRALNRPTWAALTTRQAHLGTCDGLACAYRPNIGPFGTTGPVGCEDPAAVARMVARRSEGVVLMQAEDLPVIRGIACVDRALGIQMVPTRRIEALHCPEVVELGQQDVRDMLDLVALTQPGPFKEDTLRMGAYMGVKVAGRLVAMAGERMKLPGFTEISAVCVHPGFRGQGFARCLTSLAAARIFDRGETPFLHGYADNAPAISLYRELGFEIRCTMQIGRLVAA